MAVKLKFKGIPNVQTKYRGDRLNCDTSRPDSCIVEVTEDKAEQLLKDFPEAWEKFKLEPKKTETKNVEKTSYSNKMVGKSKVRK